MELTPGIKTHGFIMQTSEDLPEIQGCAYTGVHEASGARLLYLANDDNNKSFAIGFRTPPKDDTGVFHILEHSVLCGSKRFPVKEPFVDLLKGSMQTFLNAMTFGDKTLYPVASTNEQDLFNLMDVYLDAVFHPCIYEKRAVFEQEGWHYELSANEAGDPAALPADETELAINGVVFNEMKGALSDASSVLYDEVQKALFPDNCYAFESGGTPEAIPTLTYEEYLDEHRRHYRTDNSYIILYGNLDIDRTLAFLDERYLTPVAAEQDEADAQRTAAGLEPLRPRSIALQSPLAAGHTVTKMDTAPENACAACGYVIGDSSARMRATAVEILLDALFGSNEAPLKRALLDAGVAHDVQAFVSDALLQPFAMVQLQMPAEGAAEALMGTLDGIVREMLAKGLDKSLVEAALSHAEFIMREHEMGYADGVIYSMIALSSWLYDDEAPIEYLRYEQVFSQLRTLLDGDYFEQLTRELFCENEHTASVEVVPEPGWVKEGESIDLDALNRSLTPEQRAQIVAEEALLRKLQEEPDSSEAVATLPRLSISDIGDMPDEYAYGLDPATPFACLRHEVPTHGIAYAYRYYDLDRLSFDDLPYAALLALVLGKLDTDQHTAAELDTLVQGKLGNLSFFIEVYDGKDGVLDTRPMFIVGASALSKNVSELANLPFEIMTRTDFKAADKILDILKQRKISSEQSFANAGHSCATARLKSYYTASGVVGEQTGNVGFYRFICDLIENYDQRADELASRLADVAQRLFRDDACTLSFAGSDEDYKRYWSEQPECESVANGGEAERILQIPEPTVRNEAFAVPTDICFAAMGWDCRPVGLEFAGSWSVASKALSLDYLWNEVRVKGGAYGCGLQVQITGNTRFYSYRDPHLDETIERFANSTSWLSQFDPSQEDFEGFIVSTIAKLDAPVKPRALARRQATRFLANRTLDERREMRKQILATTREDIRSFGAVIEQICDKKAICVFGNRAILESSSLGLDVIQLVG